MQASTTFAEDTAPDTLAVSATTWQALPNQGLNGSICALALTGSDLYVGGRFFQTGDGTLTNLNYIVRYDTTAGVWHPLPSRGASHVLALAVIGSDLYAGGAYMPSNDLSSIARYDTTTGLWHALSNQGLNSHVIALAVIGSDLYVGGDFTETRDGTLTNLGGIARYDTTTGTWHALPNQGSDGVVWALAVVGSDLYVGGDFTQTGDGTLANLGNIARYDTTAGDWHALPNQGLDSNIYTLAAVDSDLYAAGEFSQTGDGAVTNLGGIARYNTTAGRTWHALPSQGLDSRINTLAVSNRDLYVGGDFTQTGDGTLTGLGYIARYNAISDSWQALPNQGFDNTVLTLAVSDSDLYAGGFLTQTGDGSLTNLGYIARKALSPEITVSPVSLAFGDQDVNAGPTTSQTVTITNDGDGDLHISSLSLKGTNPGQFTIQSDSGEATLAPSATRTIQVSFDPSSTGVKSASLSIASDDADEPAVNASLSGNGVAPEITVSPVSLAFGDQDVGAGPTSSQMVTISNNGSTDLHISSLGLTGTNPGQFTIQSDSGQATLTPGATRTIQVSFDPSSTGAKSASLTIASDDSDEPTVNVTLSGTGLPGAFGWYLYLPLVIKNH